MALGGRGGGLNEDYDIDPALPHTRGPVTILAKDRCVYGLNRVKSDLEGMREEQYRAWKNGLLRE